MADESAPEGAAAEREMFREWWHGQASGNDWLSSVTEPGETAIDTMARIAFCAGIAADRAARTKATKAEPVATVVHGLSGTAFHTPNGMPPVGTKLYAAPPSADSVQQPASDLPDVAADAFALLWSDMASTERSNKARMLLKEAVGSIRCGEAVQRLVARGEAPTDAEAMSALAAQQPASTESAEPENGGARGFRQWMKDGGVSIDDEPATREAPADDAVRETIPPMTHPLGKYWEQPDAASVQIDATHATMSQATFDALLEYSSSIPSGVYEGKMWKCRCADETWLLRWFGLSDQPNKVSNRSRIIRIADRQRTTPETPEKASLPDDAERPTSYVDFRHTLDALRHAETSEHQYAFRDALLAAYEDALQLIADRRSRAETPTNAKAVAWQMRVSHDSGETWTAWFDCKPETFNRYACHDAMRKELRALAVLKDRAEPQAAGDGNG